MQQTQQEAVMIECLFVFRQHGCRASSTLRTIRRMHVVPSVGDRLCLHDSETTPARQVVTEVLHGISTEEDRHTITVYYSGADDADWLRLGVSRHG